MCACVYVPSSSSGRAARYEALDRTSARSCWNLASRPLIMIMPNEDGPKASVRVLEETEPARASQHGDYSDIAWEIYSPSIKSSRLTVTGWTCDTPSMTVVLW